MAWLTKRKWLLLVFLAAAGGAAAFVAFGPPARPGHAEAKPGAEERPAKKVAVTLAAVTPRPVQRRVQIVGSLWGAEEVVLTAKAEGQILKIHHDVGDVVRVGAVLLEIDDVDARLAVAEARAALNVELAKLNLKTMPPKGYDLKKLPTVEEAAARGKNALAEVDRLVKSGTAAVPADRDLAEMRLRVAEANYLRTVLDAEATLAAAHHREAVLNTALQKLDDTKVRVPPCPERYAHTTHTWCGPVCPQPTEYLVAQRLVSVGEMLRLSPFTGLSTFRLVIADPLKVQAPVPERHLGEIKVGQAVELGVEAYPKKTFPARVARVNPTVDRGNRTFLVEIEVPNAQRDLSAGMFARAAVLTRVDAAAPTVPQEALVTFAGVTKVFVVRDGLALQVPVAPGVRLEVKDGARAHTWVEVAGDLRPGDQVVTSGQSQLTEGTPVRERGKE